MDRAHAGLQGWAACDGWAGRVDGFAEWVAGGNPPAAADRPVADHLRRCPACREEFAIALAVLADDPA